MDLLREEADPVDLLRRNGVDSWDRKYGANFKITVVQPGFAALILAISSFRSKEAG